MKVEAKQVLSFRKVFGKFCPRKIEKIAGFE
jgi:hypothetical protein